MRVQVIVVPALLALALGACSSPSELVATVDTPTATSTVVATAPPSGLATTAAPATHQSTVAARPDAPGERLTAAQAKAGLLTASHLPAGWSATANTPEDPSVATIQPASCQTMYDALLGTGSGAKPVVSAKTTFTKGGENPTQLEMEISSFAADRGSVVEGLAKTLSTCANITSTRQGETSRLAVSRLSFPNLGDQTLAVRANITSTESAGVFDVAYVAVGHNVVTFSVFGTKPLPAGELEAIARLGMATSASAAAH